MKYTHFYQPSISDVMVSAARDALDLGFLGPGKKVKELEDSLAERYGVKHALCTSSGTMALYALFRRLLPASVAVPAYGIPVIGSAIREALGFEALRYVDVERRTQIMPDIFSAEMAVFVHPSGWFSTMRSQDKWLTVIEDASCAAHTLKKVLGLAAVLSFSAPKIVTGGQGGAILTDDTSLYEVVREIVVPGALNLRMTDVQAAIITASFSGMPWLVENKLKCQDEMQAVLGRRLWRPDLTVATVHNIVHCDSTEQRNQLVFRLGEKMIEARMQYACHPVQDRLQYPGAVYWDEHALYLPFTHDMSPGEARALAQEVDQCW